eukprot:Gb_15428 [translate_table: standard]
MKGKRAVLLGNECMDSPYNRTKKSVVVVMDAFRDFSSSALEWALAHVTQSGDSLTLLGVLPWLNMLRPGILSIVVPNCEIVPVITFLVAEHCFCSDKAFAVWADILIFSDRDLKSMKKEPEWMSDKYQKIREFTELCEKYGVLPQVKIAMGYPLRLVVLDKAASLRAAWIVLDRHLKRDRGFYMKRMPCNLVLMMNNGEADILRTQSLFLSNCSIDPDQSPAPCSLVPQVIIASPWLQALYGNRKAHFTLPNNSSSVNHHVNFPEEEEEDSNTPQKSFSFHQEPTSVH